MASIINAATSGGLVTTADTSGVLQLQTAGTTAVTVDASQRVGIGTATPAYNLDVARSGNGISARFTQGSNPAIIYNAAAWVYFSAGTDLANAIGINPSATTIALTADSVDRLTVDTAGASVTGLLNLSAASSGQIKFPATQNASANANTLDDYEEGTWTPVAKGDPTAGSGSYAVQAGYYTKIGNICEIEVTAEWTGHTGSGQLYLDGLPFACANLTAGVGFPLATFTNLVTPANAIACSRIGQSASAIFAYGQVDGGGTTPAVNITATGNYQANGSYRTA